MCRFWVNWAKVCPFLGHNYIENSTFIMILGGLKRGDMEGFLNRIHP
jgi:hypothetical protein